MKDSEMRKTVEDIERAAHSEYTPSGVKQIAIEILIELRKGHDFDDPYVESLYDKIQEKIGMYVPENEE